MRSGRRALVAALAAFGLTASAQAAPATPPATEHQLSEDDAVNKAVYLLRGSVYGDSRLAITGQIKDTVLLPRGPRNCANVAEPLWGFHVHAANGTKPLDGWIYLDAVSGALRCSTLPFIE